MKGRRRIHETFAVPFDRSDLRCSGPDFVPGHVDVVLDLRAIELVGPGIGRHGAEQIGTLLVRGLFDAFRFRPRIPDDQDKHPAIAAVHDVTLRVAYGNDFARLDEHPLLDHQLVGPGEVFPDGDRRTDRPQSADNNRRDGKLSHGISPLAARTRPLLSSKEVFDFCASGSSWALKFRRALKYAARWTRSRGTRGTLL